ncbi:MAG: hypothetical protein JWO36_6218 [Myxococcales bacterium]|nr:hypothetical protein [Myxococcales bacterium]
MHAALLVFLKHLELALRLHAAVPTLDVMDAYAHASAAIEASTGSVEPELLLAIAFVESRFDPTATSRVEGGKRKTGHYAGTAPPESLDTRASLYCGPLQTFASTWTECLRLRQLSSAYSAGVSEIETWLRDRRVHGSVTKALAGHGCGNYGVLTGRCNEYPSRVLRIEHRFAIQPPVVRVQARSLPPS